MTHVILSALMLATTAAQPSFQLTSPQVQEKKPLRVEQVANTFGCTGGNLSPQLDWRNAPAGTRSFAVTVYDPDAPTGSGWWHWIIYDIPATATSLPAGIGGQSPLPAGAQQGRNDGGAREYSGACPPEGAKAHRYVFTVFALKVDHLGAPPDASGAMIGFMLQSNSLAKATLTATYSR